MKIRKYTITENKIEILTKCLNKIILFKESNEHCKIWAKNNLKLL